MHVYICVNMLRNVCMCVCLCMYVYVCIEMFCVCACMCVNIYKCYLLDIFLTQVKKGLEQLYRKVEKHLCEEENLLQVSFNNNKF